MDWKIFWKSALVQLLAVAAVSIVLAVLLPKSFFESWGWLSGSSAWILCGAITARILKLNLPGTMLGAAVSGLPSIVFVVIGLHWLGAIFSAFLLAIWCGRGIAAGLIQRSGRPDSA